VEDEFINEATAKDTLFTPDEQRAIP